ncbi:iron-containing alcohol dehydrogenase [Parahaliea maris]|uniref:Iron-containing alcohol dehydrogenase n=1 Tax=Parahaliea maris TaxID=2716870 RepID=A0A5C8ZND1_9GAMM|nr:iron-containing alcohol dehydrogenase [Parahaliea maris]TXS89264.1 iron-containing alcohol dehydrogenase [Parahaliea maris]
MSASITLPRILRIGAGASSELVAVLGELGYARPLLITDPFMVQQGFAERMTSPLAAAGIPWGLFGECVPDPTTDSVAAALAEWQAGDYDCLVALGGGSSLDTAKAVAVLARHGGQMRDYKVPAAVHSAVPMIAIPTTAGTGSEVTRAAVITDTDTEEKMLCMGLGMVPEAALVDFELTLSMPRRLTADTGLDSLCHALEAYVSRKANPFTDGVALSAMATIARTIRTACDEPDNRAAREAMMLAATQGGMAFANASVTLIHGMSRPVGAHFHVPHGLSNAMLLPEVTAWSVSGAPARYAHCARVMDMAAAGDSDELALEKLITGLRQLNADLEVPGPAAWGIDAGRWQSLLPLMAEQALASGSPANNPRQPGAEDIVALYEKVWAA